MLEIVMTCWLYLELLDMWCGLEKEKEINRGGGQLAKGIKHVFGFIIYYFNFSNYLIFFYQTPFT